MDEHYVARVRSHPSSPWFDTPARVLDQGIHGRERTGGARDCARMVEAGIYSTRSDAELAQAALAAAGIPSVISADDAGGAYPFSLGGGARVLVDEADAEDAAAVLAAPSG